MRDIQVLPLLWEEIRDVYRRELTRDFPRDEVKPLSSIEKALRRGEYRCYGAFGRDELLAYAFFVVLDGEKEPKYLFDYLAVCRGRRNQGVGSQFLQSLMAGPLQGAACVLLEIDHPDFAKTAEERETRLKRERFYLRNGLRDTGVTANVFHVEYKILDLPVAEKKSAAQVRALYSRLYAAIMSAWVYRHMVKVHGPEGEEEA